MPSKTNADMPDSGISTAHQKYSPDAVITCLSLVSKERKFSPPTIYNKVKPTATTAPKAHRSSNHLAECPHVSGSVILAAQRLCRIGKTIHKIREDGKERHQQRIHSQHNGTLPGTCRRKEEVDRHQTEGAEKDILIERKKNASAVRQQRDAGDSHTCLTGDNRCDRTDMPSGIPTIGQ